MSTFDDMIKEATALPWEMGARLMVELRSSVEIPEQPVMTKTAARGLMKIARIRKLAKTPEEAQAMAQEAAMTDPNVVAAMDYQQQESEREALMNKVQELQVATESAMAEAEMANQQAAQATQQMEQTTALLQQAQQDRTMAVQDAMMAKDQVLQQQVSGQQHRHQIAAAAEQMAEQLKQMAATSPEEQQAQQAMAEQQAAEQEMAAQEGAAEAAAPAKQKTKKEVDEAQKAQQEAQIQTQQAQEQVAQDQQSQQAQADQAAQAAGMGGMGAPPGAAPPPPAPKPVGMTAKTGSAKDRIREQFLQKRAYYRRGAAQIMPERERINKPSWKSEENWKQRDHFADLLSLREMKKGKPLTDDEIDEVVTFYNKITGMKIPMAKDWRGGGPPYDAFEKSAAEKNAEMGKCGGCGKMAKLSAMGKCAACGGSHKTASADPVDHILEVKAAIPVERAAMIAKKAAAFKEAKLGKGRRGAENTSASRSFRKTSEVDENGYPYGSTQSELPQTKHAAMNPAKKEIGKLIGYSGVGALIGGGHEAQRLKTHEKKFGKDKPTNREINLTADLSAAKQQADRNPTYGNKLRVTNLRYKLETERMGREHPNQAVARGAARGALAGLAIGPVVHRLGSKVLKARG